MLMPEGRSGVTVQDTGAPELSSGMNTAESVLT